MSDKIRMRFPIEVGILIRGQVRSALHKLKRDVEWEEPEVVFKIDEDKGILNSVFYVEISNISAPLAINVKAGIEKFAEQFS